MCSLEEIINRAEPLLRLTCFGTCESWGYSSAVQRSFQGKLSNLTSCSSETKTFVQVHPQQKLQISMDGPNVNWSFMRSLRNELTRI